MAPRTQRRLDTNKTPSRRYTDEERTKALDLYLEHGPAEAGRRTGISARTIATWARRAGLKSESAAKTAVAV
jgi:transposase-like protein